MDLFSNIKYSQPLGIWYKFVGYNLEKFKIFKNLFYNLKFSLVGVYTKLERRGGGVGGEEGEVW